MKIKTSEPYILMVVNIEGKMTKVKLSLQEAENVLKSSNPEDEIIIFKKVIKNEIYDLSLYRKSIVDAVNKTKYSKNIIPKGLERYLTDFTELVSKTSRKKRVGREHEIEKIWSCLSRDTKCNAILVGKIGVGKKTIVKEIAKQIVLGDVSDEFMNRRLLRLNVTNILAIDNDFIYKNLIKKISEFIKKNKNNIILFVNELIYLKTDTELAILLNEIIKSNIKFISTSTAELYDEYFAEDFIISTYLNKVEILEPELKDIYSMIKPDIQYLKKKYKIDISDEMIKFVIYTSVLTDSTLSEPGNVTIVFKWSFSEAKRKGKKEVDKECVLACYNAYLELYEKLTPSEKKKIAYHEVGHYIVKLFSENIKDNKIAFVSILPMMDFLGVNWNYHVVGVSATHSTAYFKDEIMVYLGGRVAEALLTNEYSSGASSDLEIANTLAEELIMTYGLSENTKNTNRSYTTGYYLKDYLLTDKLREDINKEIKELIDEGYERAECIIKDNSKLIDVIVTELLKKEILTGEELEKICEDYKNKSIIILNTSNAISRVTIPVDEKM